MEIKNIETYWQVVDQHWDNLLSIIGHHLDFRHPAYEEPGQSDSPMTGRNILDEILFLKQSRDRKLVRYFSGVWCLASDNYAWSVPRWGILCDLCSEEWVFEET
jgi:hypothetical protein